MRAHDHELEALRAGLEYAGRGRGHADGVARRDIDGLAVDGHPPRAVQHHVDLLGPAVMVREHLAPARPQALQADPRLGGAEVAAGKPRLAHLAEAMLGRLVLDRVEVYHGEAGLRLRVAHAAQRLDVDALKRVDEVAHPGDALARALGLECRVEVRLRAPDLGAPDRVRLPGTPVDHIQLAPGRVLERGCDLEHDPCKLLAPAGLGHRLGVPADGRHQPGSTSAMDRSAAGSRSGGPWPKHTTAGSSAASLRMDSRLRAESSLKASGGACRPGLPVSGWRLKNTSPAISVRSDSRQRAMCPRVCPGVASTSKPATSSPSRRRRATGWGGPLHSVRCRRVAAPPPSRSAMTSAFSIASASSSPTHSGRPSPAHTACE